MTKILISIIIVASFEFLLNILGFIQLLWLILLIGVWNNILLLIINLLSWLNLLLLIRVDSHGILWLLVGLLYRLLWWILMDLLNLIILFLLWKWWRTFKFSITALLKMLLLFWVLMCLFLLLFYLLILLKLNILARMRRLRLLIQCTFCLHIFNTILLFSFIFLILK